MFLLAQTYDFLSRFECCSTFAGTAAESWWEATALCFYFCAGKSIVSLIFVYSEWCFEPFDSSSYKVCEGIFAQWIEYPFYYGLLSSYQFEYPVSF